MDDTEGQLEVVSEEIKVLEEGIIKLDKSVAVATFQRKEEHEENKATVAGNNAVVQILEFAKNRLNKFYNPKLYKPPPKRELTEEERISQNMGALVQQGDEAEDSNSALDSDEDAQP